MPGLRRIIQRALLVVGGVVFLLLAAWAVDSSMHDGQGMRNVSVGGTGVGGFSRERVEAVVTALAGRYGDASVRVNTDGRGFSLTTTEVGLRVRESATVQAVMDVGREGSAVSRFGGWLAAWFRRRPAPVKVSLNEGAVYQSVAARDRERTAPVEPGLTAVDGELKPVAGKPGRGVDPASVLAELPGAAAGGLPLEVTVPRGSVPPRFTMADAARLVAEGEELAARPLPVLVDDERGTVPVATLRGWLRSEPTADGLRLVVDGDKASADLAELLPKAGAAPVETRFDVVDGAVRILAGQAGTACCSPVSAERLTRAMRDRVIEPIPLPLRRVEPTFTVEQATALGVKEPVGTFTTMHKAGQPRVANIHRISDLVRGQYVPPGGTFSVNEFVGRRTAEKGFVVDHVIEDGRFTESVGGGISQFATTTFNAAFFAGLEFAEYQSHSLYISRYPFGREATLSFPHPDLKLRNPSPYGVLIWPTYTGTSVTVTLYSTKWVEATQTNQTREQRGPCTRVRT
ncbi:MAG: VanW family protein, partial [Acidimicrobiales bacterium]